ncbi:MAG: hypothetical protein ACOCZ8_04460 [Bacteroidota bacterium]
MYVRKLLLALLPILVLLSGCEVNETVTPNLQTGPMEVTVFPPPPGLIGPAAAPLEPATVLIYADGEDFRDELNDDYLYSIQSLQTDLNVTTRVGEFNPGNYYVYAEQAYDVGGGITNIYSGGAAIQVQSDRVAIVDITLNVVN